MNCEETVNITSFAFGGEACGRMASGKVCFVRGAAPGETVKVRITQDKRSFARGTLLAVLKKAPERIVPACPAASGNENSSSACCPGCSFLHVTYPTELAWKQKMLDRFVLNVFPDAAILPLCGADDRLSWRNRISLAVTPKGLAYIGDDNVTPICVTSCPIAEKSINELIPLAAEEARGRRLPGRGEKVFFRSTEEDGASYFFSSPGDVRKKRSGVIRESLGSFGKFTTFRESFFQVNRVMAEKLLSFVSEDVCKNLDFLADLYCGCGIFSIAAAVRNPSLRTFGAEVDDGAVRCANVNAEHHNVKDRCSFAVCDAAGCLDGVKNDVSGGRSAVLVDPPRTGLSAEAINTILSAAPQKIIYVSCGPDTLARDLAVIKNSGAYRLSSCKLFDLFPSTAHFESVSVLEKT